MTLHATHKTRFWETELSSLHHSTCSFGLLERSTISCSKESQYDITIQFFAEEKLIQSWTKSSPSFQESTTSGILDRETLKLSPRGVHEGVSHYRRAFNSGSFWTLMANLASDARTTSESYYGMVGDGSAVEFLFPIECYDTGLCRLIFNKHL